MYRIIAEKLFDGHKILEDKEVLFDEKGIHYVGEKTEGHAKQEFRAKFLTPGFIDLGSGIGLKEESLGKIEGNDFNETTNPVTSELIALDGINPYDLAFAKAIRGGTLLSLVLPGNANCIGGRGSLIYNNGETVLDMMIKSPVGVKFSINTEPKATYTGQKKMPMTRMGIAYLIRETLYKATEYSKDKKKLSMADEALAPLIKGEDIGFFASFRADDIATSIRIAKEFKIKIAILYGAESNLVKTLLKENKVPVAYGPLMFPRASSELKNLSAAVPAELIEEGIEVALASGHPDFPTQYLRLQAGMLVREGISPEKALSTITSTPAKILGLKNFGTISKGSSPNLVAFDNPPWETKAKTQFVFIKGRAQ
ncbi:MAG: amidohydrolase family protein [Caldisericaceae bacterium]